MFLLCYVQGEVARYGGYVVNMLHYEDAARLAFAILKGDGCEGQGYRCGIVSVTLSVTSCGPGGNQTKATLVGVGVLLVLGTGVVLQRQTCPLSVGQAS